MFYHKHYCRVTIFACQTALFINLEKKNISEKIYTSLHYYLLFAIHIYFADFFVDFSRGLKSTNSFTWMFERYSMWIEFHEWNIFVIFLANYNLRKKIKIWRIWKIGSTEKWTYLSCIRELLWSIWSFLTAYGSSF